MEYPSSLAGLARPPEELYVRGDVSLLCRAPAIAIVGSRRASERGRDIAERMGRDLAEAGVVVISGGALGIDAAAHRGSLAVPGAGVVVLPSSVDDPLPRSNQALFRSVLERGGLLVSEYRATPRARYSYCARNRIVAALSVVVVVVEATEQSGTAYTVAEARRLGRTVAAVPWPLADERGLGCRAFLELGARPVTASDDVLRLVDRLEATGDAQETSAPSTPSLAEGASACGAGNVEALGRALDAFDRQVLAVLSAREILAIEELAALLSASPNAALAAVARLEIEGLLLTLPGGRIRRLGCR